MCYFPCFLGSWCKASSSLGSWCKASSGLFGNGSICEQTIAIVPNILQLILTFMKQLLKNLIIMQENYFCTVFEPRFSLNQGRDSSILAHIVSRLSTGRPSSVTAHTEHLDVTCMFLVLTALPLSKLSPSGHQLCTSENPCLCMPILTPWKAAGLTSPSMACESQGSLSYSFP